MVIWWKKLACLHMNEMTFQGQKFSAYKRSHNTCYISLWLVILSVQVLILTLLPSATSWVSMTMDCWHYFWSRKVLPFLSFDSIFPTISTSLGLQWIKTTSTTSVHSSLRIPIHTLQQLMSICVPLPSGNGWDYHKNDCAGKVYTMWSLPLTIVDTIQLMATILRLCMGNKIKLENKLVKVLTVIVTTESKEQWKTSWWMFWHVVTVIVTTTSKGITPVAVSYSTLKELLYSWLSSMRCLTFDHICKNHNPIFA